MAKKQVKAKDAGEVCPLQVIRVHTEHDFCREHEARPPMFEDHCRYPEIPCGKPIRKSGINDGNCPSGSCGGSNFWYCTRPKGHEGLHEAITRTPMLASCCVWKVVDATEEIERAGAEIAVL